MSPHRFARVLTPCIIAASLAASLALTPIASAAPSPDRRDRARDMARQAVAYLKSQQDPATGGWAHNPEGNNLPAISGLVLTGMLLDPAIDGSDANVRRGVDYVLSFRKDDGGIYDGFLPTYNTAICVSMLALLDEPKAAEAVQTGVTLLRRAQWGAFDPSETPNPENPAWTEPVAEDHPYYGGLGYGQHGRPDLSNTQFFLQAMQDAGVSAEDPAVQRAMVFLRRVQMDERVNELPYAQGSRQGGFIYATVPDAESIDSIPGQSQAGTVEERLEDGTVATRLRAYGSMTYAGFKSLIYADLRSDDPRLQAALHWLRMNYTLAENPGLGDQGLYYYYLMLARALDAWGDDTLDVMTDQGVEERRWEDELIDRLGELQQPDGSFTVRHDRWMEDNQVLITAFALIALQHAAQ